MIAYIDLATYTFVFLYDRDYLRRSQPCQSPAAILEDAGFRTISGERVHLDLKDFASGGGFDNPLMLSIEGSEAFLECKLVREMANEAVELQLGAARFAEEGLFSNPCYTLELRDRLVSCVECLASLDGFDIGFSIYLGDDDNEEEYRDRFKDWVVGREFSLTAFVHYTDVMPGALFVGSTYVARHGRETFLKCPAWRISVPRDDVLCIFMDNVAPSGRLLRKEGLAYIREAFAYLRDVLPPE